MKVPSFLRVLAAVALLALVALSSSGGPVSAQTPTLTLESVAARAALQETETLQGLKVYRPVIEVYLQRLGPNSAGELAVTQDSYLLGRFNWFKGPRLQDPGGRWEAPEMSLEGVSGERLGFRAHGFAAALAPDWRGLDPARYTFALVRRESLGEARCFVIDVTPKKRDDGFAGRIWVEDRTFQIVRFNGINRAAEREHFGRPVRFNVDGWRANVLPGLWLPSYVYVEEVTDGTGKPPGAGTLRSQIRLWGYDPRMPRRTAGTEEQKTGAASEESALLERLTRAKLLATPGAVEGVLDTVVRNLVVTNDLKLARPVGVRVLLTAPLESFAIGNTLVLSRGLVDVLPDEGALAFMLAHELAHVVLGHPRIEVPQAGKGGAPLTGEELLKPLRAGRNQTEETAANARALELLERSPYKGAQVSAAAFLKTVTSHAGPLPNFIQSGIAGRLSGTEGTSTAAKDGRDEPGPAALPPGARLALDPWSSRLSLIPNAAQAAGQGLAPLVISPLIPHITYAAAPALDFRP